MGNLFILDTNTLTDIDWQATKKIDKSDKLILMAPKSGMLPYQIIPYLFNLKKEPEIYPFSDESPLKLAFFLGMNYSSFANGKCYLITGRTDLTELNEFELQLDKIFIRTEVYSTLESAIADKKNDKGKKTKKETTTLSPDVNKSYETEQTVNSSTILDEIPSDIGVSAEIPVAFTNSLKKYSSSELNLVDYQELIAESVADSMDGIISSFPFQLNIKLGEELGKKAYELLESHLEELKNIL